MGALDDQPSRVRVPARQRILFLPVSDGVVSLHVAILLSLLAYSRVFGKYNPNLNM